MSKEMLTKHGMSSQTEMQTKFR